MNYEPTRMTHGMSWPGLFHAAKNFFHLDVGSRGKKPRGRSVTWHRRFGTGTELYGCHGQDELVPKSMSNHYPLPRCCKSKVVNIGGYIYFPYIYIYIHYIQLFGRNNSWVCVSCSLHPTEKGTNKNTMQTDPGFFRHQTKSPTFTRAWQLRIKEVSVWYCWWKESYTSWYGEYPICHRVS